ncbi:MAG: hypothetical protein ACI8ZM_004763 [Crocinitomix sp.]|jgi:hypothetical protein
MKYILCIILLLILLPADLEAQTSRFHNNPRVPINEIDSLIGHIIMWESPDYKINQADFRHKDNAILEFLNSDENQVEIHNSYKSKHGKNHTIIHINKWKTIKYASIHVSRKDYKDAYAVIFTPNYLIRILPSRCCSFHSIVFYKRASNGISQIGGYFNRFFWDNENYLFDNRIETLKKIIFSNNNEIDFGHKTELSAEQREGLHLTLDSLDRKINQNSIEINKDSLAKHLSYEGEFEFSISSIRMIEWKSTNAYRVESNDTTLILIKGKYFHVLLYPENENFIKNPTVYLLNDRLKKFGKWNSSGIVNLDTSFVSTSTYKVCYYNNFIEDLLTGSLWFPWMTLSSGTDLLQENSIKLR